MAKKGFIPTKKGVLVGGVLAGVLVLGLGTSLVILPTINDISNANESLNDARDALTAMETKVLSYEADQESYQAIKNIDESLFDQFPDHGETQLLIEKIQDGAVQNGIPLSQLTSISFDAPMIQTPQVEAPPAAAEETAADEEAGAVPEAPQATTDLGLGHAEISIALSAVGTAEQLQGFLDYMNKLDRVAIIKAVSVDTDGEDGQMMLSFSGVIFVYPTTPDPTETLFDTPEDSEEGTVEVEIE